MLYILNDVITWDRLMSTAKDRNIHARYVPHNTVVIVLDDGKIHKNFSGSEFFRVVVDGYIAYAAAYACVLM